MNKQSQHNFLPLININTNNLSSSRLSKFDKSIIQRNKSIDLNYQQKIQKKYPLISKKQYEKIQTNEIKKQYIRLVQEMKKMSQKCNEIIIKNYDTLNQKENKIVEVHKNLNGKMKKNSFFQKVQKNNLLIKKNHDMELKKLLEKSTQLSNPLIKKQNLIEQIQIYRNQIKQQKHRLNESGVETQKLGKEIIETEKLEREIHGLENQLQVFMKKKLQLQLRKEKLDKENQRLKVLEQELFEKSYELDDYQSERKQIFWQKLNNEVIKQDFMKKQRQVQIIKKDKQTKEKLKIKEYYELLKKLEDKLEGNRIIDEKCKRIQKEIQSMQKLNQKLAKGERLSLNETIISETEVLHSTVIKVKIKKESSQKSVKNDQDFEKQLSKQEQHVEKEQKQENQKQIQEIDQILPFSSDEILKQVSENLFKTKQNLELIQSRQSNKNLDKNQSTKTQKNQRTSFFDDDKFNFNNKNKLIQKQKQKFTSQTSQQKKEGDEKQSLKKIEKYDKLMTINTEIQEQQQQDVLDSETEQNLRMRILLNNYNNEIKKPTNKVKNNVNKDYKEQIIKQTPEDKILQLKFQ